MSNKKTAKKSAKAAPAREAKWQRISAFHNVSNLDERLGLPSIPDKTVDLVLTDPPYDAEVHAGNRRGWETDKHGKKRPTKAMPMAFAPINEAQMRLYAEHFVRVCRGWILVFCGLEQAGDWRRALVEHAGAKRRSTCVWTKNNAAPKFNGEGPSNAAEAIVVAWAGTGHSVWNAGGSYGHYHFGTELKGRRHETQKPLPLIRQLLLDFSNPGQLVLDPFAGGGTTPIGCKQLGRDYLAYEIDPVPYKLGAAALASAKPMGLIEQQVYHRARKDRAYAGVTPRPTAVQTSMDFEGG